MKTQTDRNRKALITPQGIVTQEEWTEANGYYEEGSPVRRCHEYRFGKSGWLSHFWDMQTGADVPDAKHAPLKMCRQHAPRPAAFPTTDQYRSCNVGECGDTKDLIDIAVPSNPMTHILTICRTHATDLRVALFDVLTQMGG